MVKTLENESSDMANETPKPETQQAETSSPNQAAAQTPNPAPPEASNKRPNKGPTPQDAADTSSGSETKPVPAEPKPASDPKPAVAAKPPVAPKADVPANSESSTIAEVPEKPTKPNVKKKKPKDKSKELMTREATNLLVSYRMRGNRPVSWEEDISRNTLDEEQFENTPAPSEREVAEFSKPHHFKLVEDLLDGRSFEEMIANDTAPIPSFDDREKYAPEDAWYWISGLQDFLKVMQVVKKYNVNARQTFDFGCATGRVVRHFAAQTDFEQVWGSDINRRHVRWLYEYMPPQVKPVFNHCIPSLPIRDNSIDVITAFSVFTHIDTFETCWLAELRRIMHDDGLCYLTVHNENTWNILRDELDNPNNRLIQSMLAIDPDVATKIHEPLEDKRSVYRFEQSGPYRAQVFHSNNYLRKVWGRFFTIEEILPAHHVRQTVLVLRKR